MLSSITNSYEQLVLDEILDTLGDQADPHAMQDYIEDIACLALNGLPARYVRHRIDLASHLTAEEFTAMREQAARAVKLATETVKRRQDRNR